MFAVTMFSRFKFRFLSQLRYIFVASACCGTNVFAFYGALLSKFQLPDICFNTAVYYNAHEQCTVCATSLVVCMLKSSEVTTVQSVPFHRWAERPRLQNVMCLICKQFTLLILTIVLWFYRGQTVIKSKLDTCLQFLILLFYFNAVMQSILLKDQHSV